MAGRIAEDNIDPVAGQTAVGGGEMSKFLPVVTRHAVVGANPGRAVRFKMQRGDSFSRQSVGARQSEKLFPVITSQTVVSPEPKRPIWRGGDGPDSIIWQAVGRCEF